jgi:hypothetical protein
MTGNMGQSKLEITGFVDARQQTHLPQLVLSFMSAYVWMTLNISWACFKSSSVPLVKNDNAE